MSLFKLQSHLSAAGLLPAIWLGPLSAAQSPGYPAVADSLSRTVDSTTVHIIPHFNLPGITVTAARARIGTILQPSEYRLKWWQPPEEARWELGNLAGTFSKTYGGAGALQTLGVGGSEAAHTLVLIDGIPINSPQHGMLDLAIIPASLIGAIEYLPHGGLTQYGSAALSGVVSLEARPIGTGFTVGMGSYGHNLLEGNLSGGQGRTGLTLGTTSDRGDFPYKLENVDGRRENNHFRQNYLRLASKLSLGRVQQKISWWVTENHRGIPGVAWNPTLGAAQDDLWVLGSYSAAWRSGRASHQVQLYSQNQRQNYRDSRTTPASRHQVFSTGGSYEYSLSARPGFVSLTRLEGRRDRLVSSEAGRHQRYQFDLVQQLLFRLGPRVALKPALRVSTVRGQSSWLTGDLVLRFSPRGPLWRQLSLMVSRNLRTPDFNSLYWFPGGNPALYPERSLAVVAKSRWVVNETIVIDLQLGQTEYTDLIKWIPGADGIFRAINISRARSNLGLLAVEGSFRDDRWNFRLAVDLLDSRNLDTGSGGGKPLRFAPPLAGRLKLAGRLTDHWRVALTGGGRSSYITYYNYPRDTTLPATWLWDLSITRLPAGTGVDGGGARRSAYRSALTLAVTNLTDIQMQAVPGYPQPGRSLGLTLHVERKQ